MAIDVVKSTQASLTKPNMDSTPSSKSCRIDNGCGKDFEGFVRSEVHTGLYSENDKVYYVP